MGCLYSIQFPNGKMYVGITLGIAERRFHRHCTDSERGNCLAVNSALRKYGRDACILTTLVHSDDWEVLCQLEKDYISHFNTKVPNGYNLTDGGEGRSGIEVSEHTREKISKSLVGNARAKGIKFSEESRQRCREGQLGREHPEEVKRKMSASAFARWSKPYSKIRISVAWAMRQAREFGVPYSEISFV